jgi:HD-like signal output (HDOD) protein
MATCSYPEIAPIRSAQQLAREVEMLYSLPEVAFRVNEMIDDPRASSDDFAEIILNDTGITARLLKLANSPYYGFRSRVETVSRAVVLIGSQELRNLVLTTTIISVFKDIPSDVVNMETFWLKSLACGVSGRGLARQCGVLHSERMFVAGLLHAVGKLVFYSRCADRYRQVLEYRDQGEDAMIAQERQVFGFDHAELGAELMKRWLLPDSLQTAVRYHLSPADAPNYSLETTITHLASRLAQQISGSVKLKQTDAPIFPQIDTYAWMLLDLEEYQLHRITEEARLGVFELYQIVAPNAAAVF